MKCASLIVVSSAVVCVAGCSSTPVAVAPIGPNPAGGERLAATGELEVFSNLAEQSDDPNQGSKDPVWYQHADYNIYNLQGKLVKHVYNSVGHYEQAPRRVALPAGRYLVKAQAQDYLRVEVPVTIERGRTTKVHLDDRWNLPADTPKRELVSLPNGNPAGWRAEPTKEIGSN
jgi:hypothetical protein